MAPRTAQSTIFRVGRILGMRFNKFPLKYLGCLIFKGTKKLEIFAEMVTKVINRIKGWHLKFLSSGGRAVLIKHVLMTLNIHTLAAVHPPKGNLKVIEIFMARFFWSGLDTKSREHWVSWKSLCFPNEEGGVGFRRIQDTCKAFIAKQWWNFRTNNSLWSKFMSFKYCEGSNPVPSQWNKGQSHSWKAMSSIKDKIEQNILWKVEKGEVSFWFYKWSPNGPLYKYLDENYIINDIMLKDVFRNGQWGWTIFRIQPPTEVKSSLLSISFSFSQERDDRAIWTITNNGKFSVFSAWSLLRQKRDLTILTKDSGIS